MQTLHPDIVAGYRPLSELVPAHWQTGAITAEDGTRLHYTRTDGAKPAVLLLHGVQMTGLTWLRTARALEATYDVVMPDFRGHGQSGRLGDNRSPDMVQDTIALIRALELDRPIVVGHSMGADIAGRLAAAFPVRALVLVDPALRNFAASIAFDPESPPPWMQPVFEAMRALRTQSHAERMVTGLRLLMPGTPVWDEADYVSFVDAQAQFDQAIYSLVPGTGYLFESPDMIAQINCPVLLLTARPMMPGVSPEPPVAPFTSNWRTGHHVHFPDSGHFIPFDQFDRFIEVLTRFLKEHTNAD